MFIKTTITITSVLIISAIAAAQNSVPRSLLSPLIVDKLIGEASGEKAMNHIIEMGAYIHDRPAEEYSGTFFESTYIMGKLKEYGLEGAVLNKYPGGSTWDGISGSLWEVSPGRSKIADYGDLPAVLAPGSTDTDVSAELVWVGEGLQSDIDRVPVEGKIVVTSGSLASVFMRASAKGALGIVSYESPRPLQVPLAIPISGFSTRRNDSGSKRFGFYLPPREGEILRRRLTSGEKIKVHALVKAQNLEYDLEVPSCIIKGRNPDAPEIILSAHLFEGYVKMGANDNISGSAAILEIARMLSTMIGRGTIERPERTIRFIWVPEFSGTIPWVLENRELMKKTLCNINLDMVGLWLSKSQSFLCMHRTTYGNPHYINDVMENYYNFAGLGNRAGLAVSGREGFVRRIVAPTGSDDPFYYSVDDHYGSSDHEVFNDWGVQVPGIMMITWPDLYYHTSQDLADKCDPTQLKRVCFIGAAAAYTVASADDDMAMKIAAEVTGNASERIGKQAERAVYELEGATPGNFETVYKRSRGFIEAAALNEKATLASAAEIVTDVTKFDPYLRKMSASIDAAAKASLDAFNTWAETRAKLIGMKSIEFSNSDTEARAAKLIPVPSALVTEKGYRGYMDYIGKLDPKVREQYPVKGRMFDTQELGRLCNGSNSALDIRKMLDTQLRQGETDLQDVINYIHILREAGLVTFKP